MDVIFTIVSRNYAALAASLMQSVAAHEPAARRVVVATDGPLPTLEPIAEVIDAHDVGAPFRDMIVYYEALELNTAVKPYVFRHLMARPDVGSVTYLDPDIRLFRPLTAVREGLEAAELVLTPHLTRPLLGDASPNDRNILQSGSYNLGFAAMRDTAKVDGLLEWWGHRCRFDCRVDLANGLFTDQRWMDLSPGFVDDLRLIRHPGYNLAYWNLEGRTLERAPDGWRVDGEPLHFFHFSGFDPNRPKTLSKHQDRLTVEPGSGLAELLADYGKVLLGNGHASSSPVSYAHNKLADGRVMTRPMRRRALRAARAGETFPDGLGQATSAWFDEAEPEAVVPGLPDVTRVLDQAWRDSPAADPFDRTTAEGRLGFIRWAGDNAVALGLDSRAVQAAERLAAAGGGGRAPDPAVWREAPWRGPAAEAIGWLREPHQPPRAALALLAARTDLRQRFGQDPRALLAWCVGPEAAAKRFDLDLLPPAVVEDLGRDGALLVRAARFADPQESATELRRRLAVGFGVAARARWPEALTGPLRAPHLAPAEGLPAPFVRLFAEIWESRGDLQRLYPLQTAVGRVRFLRWLLAGGLAEYGVEPAALPAAVRRHPLMRLAEASLRGRRKPVPPSAPATTPRAERLFVVDRTEDAPELPAGAAVYEAAGGGFRGAIPVRADQVLFLTDPTCVPADAVALYAHGVRWSRAVAVWDAATVADLRPDAPGLGFVDEVWSRGPARADLPRPVKAVDSERPLQAALAA